MVGEADHKPTKAEKEFDGDCFGRLYNGGSLDCQICLVRSQCRRVLSGGQNTVDNLIEEKQMAKTKKSKKEKIVKVEKKAKKEQAEKTPGRMSIGGVSLNEGSYPWAMYMVLKEAMGKTFEMEKFIKKFQSFCKDIKIKFKEKRVPTVFYYFQRHKIVKKLEDGSFKNLTA